MYVPEKEAKDLYDRLADLNYEDRKELLVMTVVSLMDMLGYDLAYYEDPVTAVSAFTLSVDIQKKFSSQPMTAA
jgi:hypothetical protein